MDRPARPQLRIVTDLPPLGFGIKQPIAVRHPTLVKSAPLYAPALTQTFPSLVNVRGWQWELYPGEPHPDTLIINASSPRRLPQLHERHPRLSNNSRGKKGHARRLSDKFKNMLSSFHLKKDDKVDKADRPYHPVKMDKVPVIRLGGAAIIPENLRDENKARKGRPIRPHRSPGTASFLVTRHLESVPSPPASTSSSSTAFSIALKPTFAEKQRVYLGTRDGVDVSHFSNPTTIASEMSSAKRSASCVDELEEGLRGVGAKGEVSEEVRSGGKVRWVRSMPDVTAVREEMSVE